MQSATTNHWKFEIVISHNNDPMEYNYIGFVRVTAPDQARAIKKGLTAARKAFPGFTETYYMLGNKRLPLSRKTSLRKIQQ